MRYPAASAQRNADTEPPKRNGERVAYQTKFAMAFSSHDKKYKDKLPWQQVLSLSSANFSQAVMLTTPFTIGVFMVRDFQATRHAGHVEDVDEQVVGRLTGLLAGIFSFSSFLTAYAWGYASNYIGRKLVIVIGNAVSFASLLWFGLSGSYGTALAARAFGGFFNGILGAWKCMIGESTNVLLQGKFFGYMSLAWGLGCIAGPALGGAFSRPCSRAAHLPLCGEGQLLRVRPYFLACAVGSVSILASLLLSVYLLEETLPQALRDKGLAAALRRRRERERRGLLQPSKQQQSRDESDGESLSESEIGAREQPRRRQGSRGGGDGAGKQRWRWRQRHKQQQQQGEEQQQQQARGAATEDTDGCAQQDGEKALRSAGVNREWEVPERARLLSQSVGRSDGPASPQPADRPLYLRHHTHFQHLRSTSLGPGVHGCCPTSGAPPPTPLSPVPPPDLASDASVATTVSEFSDSDDCRPTRAAAAATTPRRRPSVVRLQALLRLSSRTYIGINPFSASFRRHNDTDSSETEPIRVAAAATAAATAATASTIADGHARCDSARRGQEGQRDDGEALEVESAGRSRRDGGAGAADGDPWDGSLARGTTRSQPDWGVSLGVVTGRGRNQQQDDIRNHNQRQHQQQEKEQQEKAQQEQEQRAVPEGDVGRERRPGAARGHCPALTDGDEQPPAQRQEQRGSPLGQRDGSGVLSSSGVLSCSGAEDQAGEEPAAAAAAAAAATTRSNSHPTPAAGPGGGGVVPSLTPAHPAAPPLLPPPSCGLSDCCADSEYRSSHHFHGSSDSNGGHRHQHYHHHLRCHHHHTGCDGSGGAAPLPPLATLPEDTSLHGGGVFSSIAGGDSDCAVGPAGPEQQRHQHEQESPSGCDRGGGGGKAPKCAGVLELDKTSQPQQPQQPQQRDEEDAAVAVVVAVEEAACADAAQRPLPWFRHPQVVLTVLGYGATALIFCAVDEVFPIFASAPRASGGLALREEQIAPPLMFFGAVLMPYSLYGYPPLQRRVGTLRLTRVGLLASVATCLMIPLVADLRAVSAAFAQVFLYGSMVVKAFAQCSAFTGSIIAVNAAPAPEQLGAVNGAGQTLAALVRGLGPALGGLLWAVSLGLHSAGQQFLTFGLIAAVAAANFGLYGLVRLPNLR